MTRHEFEQIDNFDDLKQVALEYGYDDFAYSIVTDLSDEVDNDISDWDGSWEDLRDCLNSIDTGYYYYRRDGMFDYTPIDDEFGDWWQELYDMMSDNDEFEPDGDEDEELEPEPEIPAPADIEQIPAFFSDFDASVQKVRRDVVDLDARRMEKAQSLPEWA